MKNWIRTCALFLLGAFFIFPLTGCGNLPDPGGNLIVGGTTASKTSELEETRKEVLRLVNAEREEAGVAPLSMGDGTLTAAAQLRAEECATHFDHVRPDGREWYSVLDQYGISFRAAGENLARRFYSPEEVVQGWMDSPSHRENILDGTYKKIGIGYDAANACWSQTFVG